MKVGITFEDMHIIPKVIHNFHISFSTYLSRFYPHETQRKYDKIVTKL